VPLLPLPEAPQGNPPRGRADREAGCTQVEEDRLNAMRGRGFDFKYDHDN
jgi:hypothetical protein